MKIVRKLVLQFVQVISKFPISLVNKTCEQHFHWERRKMKNFSKKKVSVVDNSLGREMKKTYNSIEGREVWAQWDSTWNFERVKKCEEYDLNKTDLSVTLLMSGDSAVSANIGLLSKSQRYESVAGAEKKIRVLCWLNPSNQNSLA